MSLRQGLGQHVSMRQDLRINPRLYQAMDLLYMPLLDLQAHLKGELLENPFLEMVEQEEEVPKTIEEKRLEAADTEKGETNWEDILLDGFKTSGWREDSEQQEYREPVSVQQAGLADYLRTQLQLLLLTPRQQLLAESMVGDIADDGYLTAPLEEVVRTANAMLE